MAGALFCNMEHEEGIVISRLYMYKEDENGKADFRL